MTKPIPGSIILRIVIPALFMLMSSNITAVEISGVQIPDSVTLSNNTSLKLNGAGIRSKFFFDIYIGALYVESNSHSAQTLINSTGANRMLMHFLHSSVSKEKITAGWTDGFEDNASPESFQKIKDRLMQFNALFSDTKKGDVILLDYIPETGTEVRINNTLAGTIQGADFNQALRRVWLGDEPADSDLKAALLGKPDE